MQEIEKVDPYFKYCSEQVDMKWELFWYFDDKWCFVQNYKCSIPLSRINYGYKEHKKRNK